MPDRQERHDNQNRQDHRDLERHAIGLPAVTAQSAALIGPAAGSTAVARGFGVSSSADTPA